MIITFILILSFVVLFLLISKSSQDKISKRILIVFVAYWALALLWSSIGVDGYFKPSGLAFFLLMANVVMFSIGFGMKKNTAATFSSNELHVLINKLIDSKVFTILLFVAFFLSVYYFNIMRAFLSYSGDLEEVRNAYFDHSMFGRAYIWLDHLFLEPMRYLCVPLFGYMVIFKRNWKFLFVTAFLVLYFSLGGGRLGYLRMIIGLVFVVYCLFNGEKINFKRIIVIGLVLIGFLYVVSIVTVARTDNVSSVSESTYIAFTHYLCGPMSAFDYAIHSDYIDRMGGYTYGRLTLSTIEGWVQYLFRVFGVQYETALQTLTEFKQGERIVIGPSGTWNALYTSQLFTWLDFGFIGCVFLPFLFGLWVKWFVTLFYKYRNWPFFVLVSAFFQISMDSTIDFRFTSPFTLLVFIFLFFYGKRIKSRKVAASL